MNRDVTMLILKKKIFLSYSTNEMVMIINSGMHLKKVQFRKIIFTQKSAMVFKKKFTTESGPKGAFRKIAQLHVCQ